MFWKFGTLLSSRIDTVLDKEGFTLQELMDEDDMLQECKAQNRKLLDAILTPETLNELVNMIIEEPPADCDEKAKYKYPNIACELLTSDIEQMNDALTTDDELLNRIYSFLEKDHPLNPLLASFFSKVMGLLITRKSEKMVAFLQSKDNFLKSLIKHLGTSAIMDLLLRLITCIDSPEMRTYVLNWLNDEKLVQKLVALMDWEHEEDKYSNASQALCDVIRLSREQMSQLQEVADPEPLLDAIESSEVISNLLNHILSGEKLESVLVSGLAVLQTLLEFKKTSIEGPDEITDLDQDRLQSSINKMTKALCPRLKDLHQVLVEPPKQFFNTMPTTLGMLEPPLGNCRLQIVRLLNTLVQTNNQTISEELARLGTLSVVLDLYFKYSWNNFLHTQVVHFVIAILSNPVAETEGQEQSILLDQLLGECGLIQKLLDCWECNEQMQSRPNGHRRGYMGHVTRIFNELVEASEKGPSFEVVKSHIEGLPQEYRSKWDSFITETLTEVNKTNTADSVGTHPITSSNEDESDFREIPFPQDNVMQQAFSDYQLQQMTSNFTDQFGFNEENFAEQEERIDAPFSDRISSIDFSITTNEESANAAMFEQACSERIQQFDDADSDDDIWDEKEKDFRFSHGVDHPKPFSSADKGSEDSSSDEEDLDSPAIIRGTPSTEQKMDVDPGDVDPGDLEPGDAWPDDVAMENVPVAMDTAPLAWESTASPPQAPIEGWASFNNNPNSEQSNESEGWANFSTFSTMDVNSANGNVALPAISSQNTVFSMDTSTSTSSSGSKGNIGPAEGRTAAYVVDNESASCSRSEKGVNEESVVDDNASLPSFHNDPESSKDTQSQDVKTFESSDCSLVEPPTQVDLDISSKNEDVNASNKDDDIWDEDELTNNFQFLSSSGLMKANDSPKSKLQQDTNGPTDVHEVSQNSPEMKQALGKQVPLVGNESDISLLQTVTQNGPV